MSRLEDYIDSILKDLIISENREKEIREEINNHLQISISELVLKGYSEEDAENKAIEMLGNPVVARNTLDIKSKYKTKASKILNQKRIFKSFGQWIIIIIVALLISLLIRSFLFAQTEVRQISMQNTLVEGQRLIEDKIKYSFSKPQRGDIIIINRNDHSGFLNLFISNVNEFVGSLFNKDFDSDYRLIKRVVGLPGDTIDIKDNKVFINNIAFEESYIVGKTFAHTTIKFPLKLNDYEYFVMGDNREHSMDSRDLGPINIKQIEGKAVFRLWPFDKFGALS